MNEYRRNRTNVSMVNYHIIFCPRYRRKIFLVDGVEERFKELVKEICERNDFSLIALECDKDYCHIFVNVPPTFSAAEVVKVIKMNTGRVLRREFEALSRMPNMWTRSYFVSTAGNVSSETIRKYVENQKKTS